MKNFIFSFCLLLSFNISSQIQTPAPSPASKVQQTIGLTDVTIEYARPSARNRVIFGNLVPYNKMWRTGANENSVISFSTSVKIGDTDVPAGKYSVYTIPNENSWEFILYSDSDNWGLPSEWDENKVAVKTTVSSVKLSSKVETFQISLDNISNNNFTLGLAWDDVYIGVDIQLPTTNIVMASINKALKNPKSSELYKAAVYLLQENRELEKAKSWMNQSLEMMEDPKFYQLRQQSLIYAALEDYENAIAIARISLEKSIKAGNSDYEKMNLDSIDLWGSM
jgi:hypothetical protein